MDKLTVLFAALCIAEINACHNFICIERRKRDINDLQGHMMECLPRKSSEFTESSALSLYNYVAFEDNWSEDVEKECKSDSNVGCWIRYLEYLVPYGSTYFNAAKTCLSTYSGTRKKRSIPPSIGRCFRVKPKPKPKPFVSVDKCPANAEDYKTCVRGSSSRLGHRATFSVKRPSYNSRNRPISGYYRPTSGPDTTFDVPTVLEFLENTRSNCKIGETCSRPVQTSTYYRRFRLSPAFRRYLQRRRPTPNSTPRPCLAKAFEKFLQPTSSLRDRVSKCNTDANKRMPPKRGYPRRG